MGKRLLFSVVGAAMGTMVGLLIAVPAGNNAALYICAALGFAVTFVTLGRVKG
jgi:hypothetical protein